MVGLGRGQQVHEGGEAAHHREEQGSVVLIRHAHTVLQAADQLALPGEEDVHRAGRQALDEGRVAQQVLVGVGVRRGRLGARRDPLDGPSAAEAVEEGHGPILPGPRST